jgi:hypothetical protein
MLKYDLFNLKTRLRFKEPRIMILYHKCKMQELSFFHLFIFSKQLKQSPIQFKCKIFGLFVCVLNYDNFCEMFYPNAVGKIGNLIDNQFPTSPLCKRQV